MNKTIKCEICGKEETPNSNRQKYCFECVKSGARKRHNYNKNKIKRCADAREWRKNNKNKYLKCIENWREKNKGEYERINKAYKKANPDKVKEWNKKAYYKEKDTPEFKHKSKIRTYMYKFQREKLLKERGNCCEICKSKKNLHIHHKKYTKNTEDLVVLCLKCHRKIHNLQRKTTNGQFNEEAFKKACGVE